MALILNIETATKNCSVALSKDGTIIASKELNDGNYSHSENLHVFIDDILKEVGKSTSDLEAVALSKGPGSYTGLRIGAASAKGFCYALDIPLIAVNTLKVMAAKVNVDYPSSTLISLLDARRMEVYSCIFDSDLNELRATQAEIIDENSFSGFLQEDKCVLFGDGAEKCKELVKSSNITYVDGVFPSAKQLVLLAEEAYKNKQFEDMAYFEPYYLKDFVATTPKRK